MELPFLVGQGGHHLVGRHPAPFAVESGEDGDGRVEVRLADMNKRDLIISKGVGEAICFLEPASTPARVINLRVDTAACVKEPGGVEQASHRKMLWPGPPGRCSDELPLFEVAVHAPVDLIDGRFHPVGQPQRTYEGRHALLAIEQVANHPVRARIDVHRPDAIPGLDSFLGVPDENGADRESAQDTVEQCVQVWLLPHKSTLEPRHADFSRRLCAPRACPKKQLLG